MIVGARFRPAAAGRGARPAAERAARPARSPRRPAPRARRGRSATRSARSAAAQALLDVTGRLVAASSADLAIARAAALLRDPAARTEDIAGRVGLSERQLRRRTHAAAGYGPKTLQRILRFQRFVRTVDASEGPLDLAAAAATAGYADQSHLTRESVALSGLTPAALAGLRG